MAAKSARRRASTGLMAASATFDGAEAATSALDRRATTLHAATGIAAASAMTVRIANVRVVGLG